MKRGCTECGTPLGPRNRSGYCRGHAWIAAQRNPAYSENQLRGIRRKHATDPAYVDGLRKRARALGSDPAYSEKRREVFCKGEYWRLGAKAAGPSGSPARVKAGQRISANRLSWCPPHLRDEYRRLINSKGMKAVEARQMILDQHDAEMQRFRREIDPAARAESSLPPPNIPAVDCPVMRATHAVSHAVRIDVASLMQKDRRAEIITPRRAIMLAARRAGMGPVEIGRRLKIDHTTVCHHCAVGEELEADNPAFARLVAIGLEAMAA